MQVFVEDEGEDDEDGDDGDYEENEEDEDDDDDEDDGDNAPPQRFQVDFRSITRVLGERTASFGQWSCVESPH